jgi:hypothetical protein
MERSCSTGQSPQWAVVPMEEEEEEDPSVSCRFSHIFHFCRCYSLFSVGAKNVWSCTSVPPYTAWCGASLNPRTTLPVLLDISVPWG